MLPDPIRSPAGFAKRLQWLSLLRVHHWWKQSLVVCGAALGADGQFSRLQDLDLLWAILSVSFMASANYVLNEVLDAPFDRLHPRKSHRPAVTGAISPIFAYLLAVCCGGGAILLATAVQPGFWWCVVLFGLVNGAYNLPPLRTKDRAIIDVAWEALNSPLRIWCGWVITRPQIAPSPWLLLAFWGLGGVLMSEKRRRELRAFPTHALAMDYRPVFAHYHNRTLLAMSAIYAAVTALCGICWWTT
jgi:4-hydroxybenzoate polyprenyltransferase